MSEKAKKVRTIIPADGWLAVYIIPGPPYYHVERLVCFGVVDETTEVEDLAYVAGFRVMDAAYVGEVSEADSDFLCLVHQDDVTPERIEEWEELGKEWVKNHPQKPAE